ncbi:MAG: hypothetical protein JW901_04660 [Dehalococcoidia bacterium]|nr:hypothetical protein [Dehalococcoidia bacterium]
MKTKIKRLAYFLAVLIVVPSLFSLSLPEKAGALACHNIVYVNDATGNDAWDGSSPVHTAGNVGPRRTIQAGIDTVCAAGTVNIAAGTYNQADFITINKSLTLLGAGAASTVINGSADPEDEVIGIYALNGGNVLIYGLTIQNGNWNGIYVDETALNNTITINDCVITHNDSIDYGGGIWIDNDNIVTLNRCTVSNNSATWVDDFAPAGRRAPADSLEGAFFDDESGGLGGGIAAFGCTLNLNQCTISNNTAAGDLGIGGGIFAVYDTTLNMTDCTVSGNLAGRWGGGIFYGLTEIGEATATVNNCNISNNLAGGGGGGLFILGSGFLEQYLSNPDALFAGAVPGDGYAYQNLDGFYALDQQLDGNGPPLVGPVHLNNCTVSNNAALNWGGGMSSAFSLYSLNGCTFSGNRAGLLGGGIGTLISLGNLINCTVSGNSLTYPEPPPGLTLPETGFNPGEGGISGDAQLPPVSNAGGGIASIIGMSVFESDTIANNSTGSDVNSYGGGLFNSRESLAIFVNTIVACNTAVQQGASNCLNRGTVQSVGHNIDSLNECGFDADGDQINTDPALGPLQNNGGPTLTCAVGVDSPAFNRGDNENAPATDQRGVVRPQAVNCTIGAYEVGLNKSATTTVATGLGNATFTTNVGGIVGLTAHSRLDCVAGSNLSFPFGYFSFRIVGLVPGATAVITITLPATLPAGAFYYKCLNGVFVDCTSLMNYSPGDYILTIAIKDGGPGDGDGAANGTIVDPGGPAVRYIASVTPQSSSATLPPAATRPIDLPNIVVQSASLSSSSVKPGDTVTVNATVANRGTAEGTSSIKLLVNGGEETSRHVTIESGKTAPLTFTVTRSQPGSYSVSAGGVPAGSFTVADQAQPDLLLIISVTFILVALIGGFIYMRGRQRHI